MVLDPPREYHHTELVLSSDCTTAYFWALSVSIEPFGDLHWTQTSPQICERRLACRDDRVEVQARPERIPCRAALTHRATVQGSPRF